VAGGRSHRSNAMKRYLLSAIAIIGWVTASADELSIRRSLAIRMPGMGSIEAIRPGPLVGIWEIQVGGEVIYSDADANFLIEGEVIDTRTSRNLTAQREAELQAFDFRRLPLADAVVWKRGSGARHLVVFADPNCGYCRQLERMLNDIDNITVHTFVIPILGDDSQAKARAIWCARDQGVAWRHWMIDSVAPAAAPASCDSAALARNLALQRRHGVVGTPSLVFVNGERLSGIPDAQSLERRLQNLRLKE
jgi:thiol:disulfide interchange protein DsbC